MKKIRINELARELEVKAHEILDRLPELGVSEKKTHSSSIDEDVAIKLRRYYGHDVPDYVESAVTEPEMNGLDHEGHEASAAPAQEHAPSVAATPAAPAAVQPAPVAHAP